jgi:hypothetical protein
LRALLASATTTPPPISSTAFITIDACLAAKG